MRIAEGLTEFITDWAVTIGLASEAEVAVQDFPGVVMLATPPCAGMTAWRSVFGRTLAPIIPITSAQHMQSVPIPTAARVRRDGPQVAANDPWSSRRRPRSDRVFSSSLTGGSISRVKSLRGLAL